MNEALDSYFAIVRRAWRVIAGITLLCVCGAAMTLLFAPPEYQSTAALLVSTPRDNEGTGYRGDEYSRQRRSTYAVIGASPELAQRVIDDMALSISPAALISQTTVALVPDTVLLSLTTVGRSPAEAQGIAQAYVQELTRSVAALEAVPGGLTPRAELIVVQPPTYDVARPGFPAWIIIGVAGAGGLIVSSFVVVLAALLDGRIRSAEDAVEASAAPVLASFEFNVRGKRDQFGVSSIGESARLLRTAVDGFSVRGARTLLIGSVEQGAARTRVALELGRVLADRGSTVVVVDFNGREAGSITELGLTGDGPTVSSFLAMFAVTPRDTSHGYGTPTKPVAPAEEDAGGAIATDTSALRAWHGVAVLPFGEPTYDPGSAADDPRLPELIRTLHERYEWVLFDAPSIANYSDAVRLVRYCDAAVVVVQLGRTRFDGLRNAGDELSRAGRRMSGIVLSDRAPAIIADTASETEPEAGPAPHSTPVDLA